MHVILTVTEPGGIASDVAVQSSATTTLAELRPVLAAELGWQSDHAALPIASDGRPLPGTAELGGPGLRPGCILGLGPAGNRRPSTNSVVSLRVVAGPGCGLVVALSRGNHVIGRSPDADIVVEDPEMSRLHAELRVDLHEIAVRDLHSTNGTRVAETLNDGTFQLVQLNCPIFIGSSMLVIAGAAEPPAVVRPDGNGALLVHRPPRTIEQSVGEVVDFPHLAKPPVKPRVQWVAAVLPAVVAGVLALSMRSTQFLAFALLSPVTVFGSAIADRRSWRRAATTSEADAATEEAGARQLFDSLLVAEAAYRRRHYPDAAAVLLAVCTPDCRLWERRPQDEAFLQLRLGIADQPAWVTGRRGPLLLPHAQVDAAPATVSLRAGALGIAGPRNLTRASARWLVAQLLALHSPNDVRLVAILDRTSEDWRWLRWAAEGTLSIAVSDEERRRTIEELAALVTERAASGSTGQNWSAPWTVVLIDPADAVAGLGGLRTVLQHGPAVGISALCVAADQRVLPPDCRSTAITTSATGATLELCQPLTAPLIAIADRVSLDWADLLARSLAPLADPGAESGTRLPTELVLTDLLGLEAISEQSIRQRWAARDGDLAVPVGACASGNFQLDLVRDGPHLLIAGTTGSGKSELLRSLVAAIAASSPPQDTSFVLIDYKGGAAFRECAGLPHTLGVVTDLDAHLTRRALVCLDAELRRREAAFAVAGVADLASYRQTAAAADNPVPRLVLVIDEFATLAEELPTFLTGLLSIAQRGRSLGVHLVLATQRPAGVVSADIKANISLRIALRVTDPAESIDVIGAESASLISRQLPGRAYVRLAGGELIEFQAARVGLPLADRAAISVTRLDEWNRPLARVEEPSADNDLDLLCAAVQAAAEDVQAVTAATPWLAPLPDQVVGGDLALSRTDPFQVALALVDDPARQRQYAESVDLAAGGSIGFIGGPRSGRTTALRSIIGHALGRLDCTQLNVYVLDCAGQSFNGLRQLPHCGAVLNRDDPATVARLIGRLADEVIDRQRQLAEGGSGSFAEARCSGSELPAILLAVDGWEGLAALSDDYDTGRTADALVRLLRDGPSVGLTTLVTGDRAALGARLGSALGRKFLLRMTDREDYALAGISPALVPGSLVAGRAILADSGLEAQLALLAADPSPAVQNTALLANARSAPLPKATAALRIRQLPDAVDYESLLATGSPGGECLLGLGGDDASVVSADLFAIHTRFLITGPARSGRSSAALLIARQAHAAGLRPLIAAPRRSPLWDWARAQACPAIEPNSDADDQLSAAELLLVDDAEQFTDTAVGDHLLALVRQGAAPAVVTARADDLMVSFRGLGVEMRRYRHGLLLQPGAADGELLAVRTGPYRPGQPAGRGVLVSDRTRAFAPNGLPLQLAR